MTAPSLTRGARWPRVLPLAALSFALIACSAPGPTAPATPASTQATAAPTVVVQATPPPTATATVPPTQTSTATATVAPTATTAVTAPPTSQPTSRPAVQATALPATATTATTPAPAPSPSVGVATPFTPPPTAVPVAVDPAKVAAVEQFYALLTQKEYEKAYALFTPTFQAANPYDRWMAGYAGLKGFDYKVSGNYDGTVWVDLTTREGGADGAEVIRQYSGRWLLTFSAERQQWLLARAEISRIK